jgi:lycopene cyclase domain-containing protein
MTYAGLNAIFLAIAFAFFVATMAAIGVHMARKARLSVSDRDSATLAPPTDARRTPGQRTEIPPKTRRPNLGLKYAITLVVLLAFTAVFDNLIIGAGIVAYDPAKISGIYIGIAPIEDFAYSVAAVLVLPTLWGLLGHFGPFKGTPTVGSAGSVIEGDAA